MNERIRQLAEQSGFKVNWQHADVQAIKMQRFEKFAQLIVRECASVALEQKKWVEDQKIHNPEDESWNRARIQQSQHIVDKIKQHFGIGTVDNSV